jgi:hypothetical protein
MRNLQRAFREGRSDPGGLPLKQLRPLRIVVDNQDAAVQGLYLAHVG